MIPCKLRPQLQKYGAEGFSSNQRFGTYTQCYHHEVKGYGKKAWVVCADILLDYDAVSGDIPDQEIVAQCIAYLNTPQKSRYGKRRNKKLPYGTFAADALSFRLREKNGEKYFQVRLVTNQQKNKKFWREGPSLL